MPLLDHFRPPVFPRYPWESFHSFWAAAIAGWLNQTLPQRYLATIQTHLGTSVEADVAEFEHAAPAAEEGGNGPVGSGALATAIQPWAPPAPALTMSAEFPDDLEVQIQDQRDDARLVAVVELVSPRNKDRPEARRAFAAKCSAYLQRGIGLVVVDVVTHRQTVMHNELVGLMELGEAVRLPQQPSLLAVAYRPVHRGQRNEIDVWPLGLTLGSPLPVVPLPIKGHSPIPLDLETTYTQARQQSRL